MSKISTKPSGGFGVKSRLAGAGGTASAKLLVTGEYHRKRMYRARERRTVGGAETPKRMELFLTDIYRVPLRNQTAPSTTIRWYRPGWCDLPWAAPVAIWQRRSLLPGLANRRVYRSPSHPRTCQSRPSDRLSARKLQEHIKETGFLADSFQMGGARLSSASQEAPSYSHA
jgi:hypothetical protein